MASTIRYVEVTNTTNPARVMTPADWAGFSYDKDAGLKIYKRAFAGIDVGPDAGKTQHNAGCWIANSDGPKIRLAIALSVIRPAVVGGQTVEYNMFGVGAVPFKFGFIYSADRKSVYLQDGAAAAGQIAANDILVFGLVSSNY